MRKTVCKALRLTIAVWAVSFSLFPLVASGQQTRTGRMDGVPAVMGDTPTAVSALRYGAKCDGVFDNASGLLTGTDDHLALQNAFNALGSNGLRELNLPGPGTPNGSGTTTGICLSSTQLTVGNGSSAATSTQNAFAIRGSGGRQLYLNGAGGYIPPTSGTSVIAYIGPDLGTSAFITVAGPLHDIQFEGFAADCRNLSQTCLYFTGISGSRVHDVFAMNNSNASNPYNAGFWVSAYNSTFSGESGSQNNMFEAFGSIGLNSSPSGIMIGCPDLNCAGAGVNAGYDVSLNSFVQGQAAYYGSNMAIGLVVGYEDSNTFQSMITASQEGLHVVYQTNGFPGNNDCYECHFELANAWVGTFTLNGNITASQTTGINVTTTGGSIPCPSFIRIDGEILKVISVSGNILTVAARGSIGGTPNTSHGAGSMIGGPFGYMINSSGTYVAGGYPANVFFFDPLTTIAGAPVGTTAQSQIAPAVYGVVGQTQSGMKFNSNGSTALNPLAAVLCSSGSTVSNASGAVFNLTPAWTIPASQLGFPGWGSPPAQGEVIRVRGKLSFANLAGFANTIYPAITFRDNAGPVTWQDTRGYSIPNGIRGGVIEFDGVFTLTYRGATPYSISATYTPAGRWLIDDQKNTPVMHTIGGPGGNSGRDTSGGITVALGVQFGAKSPSTSATLDSLNVWVETPSSNGLF
jgi:hypothetical protein